MKLLLEEHRTRMLANGAFNRNLTNEGKDEIDFQPIVKLFTPWGAATWLLSELDPEDCDIAFGLCDLGMGCPELGNVRISELESVRGPLGLRVERDRHWRASKSLGAYADEARIHQRISA